MEFYYRMCIEAEELYERVQRLQYHISKREHTNAGVSYMEELEDTQLSCMQRYLEVLLKRIAILANKELG